MSYADACDWVRFLADSYLCNVSKCSIGGIVLVAFLAVGRAALRNTAFDHKRSGVLLKCVTSFISGASLMFLALYAKFGDLVKLIDTHPGILSDLAAVFVAAGFMLLVCDFTTSLQQLREPAKPIGPSDDGNTVDAGTGASGGARAGS